MMRDNIQKCCHLSLGQDPLTFQNPTPRQSVKGAEKGFALLFESEREHFSFQGKNRDPPSAVQCSVDGNLYGMVSATRFLNPTNSDIGSRPSR